VDTAQAILQTITISVAAGIAMQVLSQKLKLPSIAFLMFAGILLGPQFLDLVNPAVLGSGLEVLVSLAVALILFEGGLSLDFETFKTVNQPVRNMLSIGLIITMLGSALAAKFLLDLSWSLSFLFGSFMTITGLTVINPILQRVKVDRKIATILRSEGILSNPIGAFLSVGVLEIILASKQQTWVFFLVAFLMKICVGLLVGFALGWILGIILKKRYIEDDLKNLVVFAAVFTIFFVSNLIEPNTGILAVVVAGFAVQRENIPQLNKLKRFKGQLSVLFISILFIMISANLNLDQLLSLGWKGIAIVVASMIIIRPLAIFISNINTLDLKEKLFISWIGPKGIVSASVASLFTLILVKNGIEGAELVEALVFLVIMATVIIQGMSARRAAAFCDCLLTDGTIIVVGGNALGRTLATAFRELGKEVVLIDNNQDHCDLSLQDSIETVCGNALDIEILDRANIQRTSLLIATTANAEVNYLVCQLARDLYSVPEVYPAIDSPDKGVNQHFVNEIGGNLAYAKPVNIEDWKLAVEEDQVRILDLDMPEPGKNSLLKDFKLENVDDNDWIPLILKRKNGYFFVHADQVWSKGDILIYLSK
jgi:NhaP-type Na+/H+ or K+/H+ antiporter